ncbi:MAG: shikimate dehydrogenase, partial [Bacillota bacterium]|nr:shikimate dehydrogenase [Bacillota bacterium]
LDSFMTNREFKAINVTIPYKRDVIPYLEEMDDAAKKIGAVNTIVNKDGKLYGHNTDYYGFRYMVEKHFGTLEGKKVLVLGNGGASKAIQAVVQDLGAKEMIVTDIILSDGIYSIEEVYEKHPDCTVIMNTSPCGMFPKVNTIAADLSKFPVIEAVFDCVYNPMDTEFTLQAKARGAVAVTGLEMLVGQAKRALEFFKEIEIEDSEIDRIYREILLQTTNCVIYNNDTQIIEEVAKALGKEVIVLSEQYKEECILSNKLLVAKEDMCKKELSRNSIIVSGNTAAEIVDNFKKAINEFNN